MSEKTALRTPGPTVPPEDWPEGKPLPNKIIFREISLKMSRTDPVSIRFEYFKSGRLDVRNGFSDVQSFESHLLPYLDDRDVPNRTWTRHNRDGHSIRNTHMSLKCGEPTIVVFKLRKIYDWQFRNNGSAITVPETYVGGPIFHSRTIRANGTIIDPDDLTGGEHNDCRYCYFVVEGSDTKEYAVPFNIHLELPISESTDGGREIFDYLLPIVVDPDVRWPGGSD